MPRTNPPHRQDRQPGLEGSAAIVNTTSVTAYRGNPTLIDYEVVNG